MLCIRGTSHGPVSVSVSACLCLSQVGVLLKRLNVGSPVSAFCTAIHSVVTGEPRDFKFGTLTYHSKSHPADEKYSLKGAWSGSGELCLPRDAMHLRY